MKTDLAVIGGGLPNSAGGTGSVTPTNAPNTLQSQAWVEIIEAWGWGEIEAFPAGDNPLKYVYLNGVPVMGSAGNYNYSGVTFDWRPGTQSQTYIQGTSDAVGSPIAVSANVIYGTPIIRSITDSTIDAVDIIIDLPNGLSKTDLNTGNRGNFSVSISIDISVDGGASWVHQSFAGRENIVGKQDSAYQRIYNVNLRAVAASAASYEIKVTRLSVDDTPYTVSIINWNSYTQLSHVKLRRPNISHCRITFNSVYFSSIPTRAYLLRGQIISVPNSTVYNPITRTYTGADWDGTFTTSWSRNPAWFLYWLLTTPGQGLGADINPAYQDKWIIYTIAQVCDALVPDGYGGQEPRYSIDYFFQAQTTAVDMIQTIAGIFDAMALWSGQSVFLSQDAQLPVSALFMPANIVGGRFLYAGSARQVRYTAAFIQYSDPNNLYQLATEYVEDLAGIQRYGFRPKTEAAIGVISRGQAHRHGLRLLTTARMEIDSVTFSVGLTGISQTPGDIIRIADPLRYNNNRFGGRISLGSTASAIVLDAPVNLQSGFNYRLAVIGSDGSVWDSAVINAAGQTSVIDISPAYSGAPAQELEWIVYDANADVQTYRILRITDNQDVNSGFYTVIATAYDLNKYAIIDAVASLPPLPPNPYIQLAVSTPSNLTVTVGTLTQLQGISRYMDISWSPSSDVLLSGYWLTYSLNGATVFGEQVAGTSYRVMNPLPGDYIFSLAAIAFGGLYSPAILSDYTLGILYLIGSVSIQSLALKSGGLTFNGRDIELTWSNNAATVLGSTYANGAGGQSPWFRDYQIDVYNGSTLLRSDYDTSADYLYTYAMNVADGGPNRSLSFTVRARDNYGNYSIGMTVTVSNPEPAAIAPANVSLYNGYQSIVVNYIPPTDNDYAGVIIFLGSATGFTPGTGNRAYLGNNEPATLTNLTAGTTYYLRIATFDAFGGANDYVLSTTEYNYTVTAVSAIETPANIQAGLQSALDTDANALVFDASNFGIRLAGTTKTPFIVGSYNGSAAILMDATVVVTGPLSASQLVSGTIDAGQTITIGNGDTVLNGDGSIVCYNGGNTISNRDFAMLNSGEITFQKYRNGAYQTYKSLRRVEYGNAASGSTVTLPGFWDSQPNLQVSPAALQTFNGAQNSQSLSWQVRADNLRETITGSGVWQFDAVAQLTYSSASGSKTVSSQNSGGAGGTYSWTSAADTLPVGTISVIPTVSFSSIRGNGSSTYGYYYRSVNWKIQASSGSGWSDVSGAAKTRNILQSEHGNVISDTMAANLPAGTTQIRVVFTASDTNGTTYSQGANAYNLGQDTVASNGASVNALAYESIGSAAAWHNNSPVTLTGSAYSTPAGWSIYAVDYSAQWRLVASPYPTTYYGYSNGNYIYKTFGGGYSYDSGLQTSISTGPIQTNSYDANFWKANADTAYHVPGILVSCSFYLENPTAIVYRHQLIINSTTSNDNFTFVSYAWNISGSTAIATGSLNWIAVGD